ncbi:MAG: PRC-barrel domain-containing protein [Candidatus Cyclobacteriaceae bacterium M3_2C_046]
MNNTSSALVNLNNLEESEKEFYKPDLRGWTVLGAKSHRLGIVDDLIIDQEEMRVRYLDVKLDTNDHTHILIPVGLASLNKKEKYIVVIEITKAELSKFPVYKGGPVHREFEVEVRKSYYPRHVTLPEEMQSDFYNHDHFNEHSLFGQRDTRRSRFNKKGDSQTLNFGRAGKK